MMRLQSSPLALDVVQVTPFRQNCSILWNTKTKHGIVIDPGGEVSAIGDAIARHELVIDKILITHGHLDHAGGALALFSALQSHQDVCPELIGPDESDDFLLASIERQAAFFHWHDPKNVVVDRFVKPGEKIPCLGEELDVVHVPGHTPGHVAYVDPVSKIAFVGDILFHDTIGRTDFSYGNHEQLVRGIKNKLLPLGDDILMVPGHGQLSTFGQERLHNPRLKER